MRGLVLEKLQELQKSIERLESNIDPVIELRNGEVHNKRMSEAVKESWKKIQDIYDRIEKLDERTLVLKDIEQMVDGFKLFKTKFNKYFTPLLKILFFVAVTIILFYLLASNKLPFIDFLKIII